MLREDTSVMALQTLPGRPAAARQNLNMCMLSHNAHVSHLRMRIKKWTMATSSVVCVLCSSRSPSLSLWLSHLRQVHRTDTDISLQCPVRGCSTTYKKVNSFCSHMYRQHREEITNKQESESASTLLVSKRLYHKLLASSLHQPLLAP